MTTLSSPGKWATGDRYGFYPGSEPAEYHSGTADQFDQARAGFEAAWAVFLADRTEADFQSWRDDRDWHTRKYAMWERGEKLPTQKPNCAVLAARYLIATVPSTACSTFPTSP